MLRRLLAIPPGDGRIVALLGLHEFMMLAATTAQGTAADALFLEAFPASRLPWVYGAGSVLSAAVTLVYGFLRARLPAARVHRTVVVGLALMLVAMRLAEPLLGNTLAFLFLLMVPVSAALLGLERVRLLNNALDPRSARRVLPMVGALGGIGATAGALLVARLSQPLGTVEMFWFASGFLLLTLLPARRLGTREQEVRRAPPAPAREVLRRPYALLLMAIILLAAVLATLARFQVGAAAQATLAPEKIASFYGTLYGLLNAVSIVFALVVSRAAITHLGVRFSLLAYPLVMGLSGVAGIVAPGLLVAGGTVFSERLLRQNVQRPTRRIATLPLPDPVRVRMAMMEEGVLTPAATLLTSLGILALLARLPWTVVPYFILGTATVLIFVLLRVRRDYAGQLVGALHARTLQLPDDADVELVLDPPVRELLHRQVASTLPENVALGLDLLTGHATRETVALVERQWEVWPPWLRARAVALLADAPTQEAKRFLDSCRDAEDELVRAALLEAGIGDGDSARATLEDTDAGWRLRAAALRRVREVDGPAAAARTIDAWLASEDVDARRAAVYALAGTLHEERHRAACAEVCVRLLAGDDTYVDASGALAEIGDGAVEALAQAVADPARSARAISVLGEIPGGAARGALLELLERDDDEVRFRAAKALARQDASPTAAEAEVLEAALERELDACRDAANARASAKAAGVDVLEREAAGDATWALERALLLLSALEPGPPFRRLFLAVEDAEGEQRNLAIEALDALLPATWKGRILPFLEVCADVPDPFEDPDPWRRRLARAHENPGEDEAVDLALRLAGIEPFAGWRIRDLVALVGAIPEAEEEPSLWIRDGEVTNLQAALLATEAPPGATADADLGSGALRVPVAAVYEAIADRSHCAAPWLSTLAGRLAKPEAETTDLTRSHELSLASRKTEEGDAPANELDLWRRLFFLKTSGLTQGLSVDSLTAVARIARSLSVTRGDLVVREGRTGRHFYLVCAGTLEVLVGGEKVAVLAPGDAVGELALLSGERRMGSIRALEAGELLTIERTDLLDLLDTHPALVVALSRLIARRMRTG